MIMNSLQFLYLNPVPVVTTNEPLTPPSFAREGCVLQVEKSLVARGRSMDSVNRSVRMFAFGPF